MEREHVSEYLANTLEDMWQRRDAEIRMADEVLDQYITDHNDSRAYREKEAQVNRLARAWDKMIAKLKRWEAEARKIEGSCENFYGD